MKLKNLFITLGLTLAVGIGVCVGLNAKQEVKAAKAYDDGVTYLYLTGNFGGDDHWTNYVAAPSDGDNAAVLLNYTLAKGDTFKFKEEGTWDNAVGFSALDGGSARNAFKEAATNGNIEVAVGGTYDFYVTSSKRLYVEFRNVATAYVQVKDWANTYVYAFDETTESGVTMKPLGDWPGTRMNAHITNDTNFAGSLGGIAKVEILYHTLANTKLIINNGDANPAEGVGKSSKLDLVDGYYYWNTGKIGDSDYGAQAKVVWDINKAIVAAEDSSVCRVDENKAQDLIDEYDALGAQNLIDASVMNTWDKVVGDSKANHTYEEFVAKLRVIAAGGAPTRQLTNVNGTSNIMLLVIIISSAALVSVGGFFLLKKKREN